MPARQWAFSRWPAARVLAGTAPARFWPGQRVAAAGEGVSAGSALSSAVRRALRSGCPFARSRAARGSCVTGHPAPVRPWPPSPSLAALVAGSRSATSGTVPGRGTAAVPGGAMRGGGTPRTSALDRRGRRAPDGSRLGRYRAWPDEPRRSSMSLTAISSAKAGQPEMTRLRLPGPAVATLAANLLRCRPPVRPRAATRTCGRRDGRRLGRGLRRSRRCRLRAGTGARATRPARSPGRAAACGCRRCAPTLPARPATVAAAARLTRRSAAPGPGSEVSPGAAAGRVISRA
jgi:hypothetical protein